MLFTLGVSLALSIGFGGNVGEILPISSKIDEQSISAAQEKALDLATTRKAFIEESVAKATSHTVPSKCFLNQNCFKNSRPKGKEQARTPKTLIFVSSSMPKSSLQELAKDAKQLGARLIIRGMVNNSMKETALFSKELNNALDIDPKLFKKFNVREVPTFAVPQKINGLKQWMIIRGNVNLTYALEKGKGEIPLDIRKSPP